MKAKFQIYRKILILMLGVSITLLGITCVVPAMQKHENLVQTKYVYPSGEPVGIYMHAKGVLVVDCGSFLTNSGKKESPVKYKIKKGDYIISVNGQTIERKDQLINEIEKSEGNSLVLSILRDGEIFTTKVSPTKNVEDIYKLGIWICDSTQGIGTMTYVTTDGKFAALGHGIADNTSKDLLQMKYGAVYHTEISAITKGKKNEPGELTGVIALKQSEETGDIFKNCDCGIFGRVQNRNYVNNNLVEIAQFKDIKIDDAEILCKLDEEKKSYRIRITDCRRDFSKEHKDIAIMITDPDLLNKTGGIIQGMSGAPIIQNGKLIGAVTHVCVENPTKGYGIFIGRMLEQ